MRRLLLVAATVTLMTGSQPPGEPAGTITVNVSIDGPSFVHSFPPNSLTILRIPAR